MRRRFLLATVTGAAALGVLAAPAVVPAFVATPDAVAQPCYSGVIPGNPYVRNCTIPGPQNRIRGSAPDANAIIACRNWPGCLSWYVNGGPGYFNPLP